MAQPADHYVQGVQRQELGDLEGALAYLKQVGPEEAVYADAQARLARLYLDADRPTLAEIAARKALGEERTAPALMLLGEALAAQEQWTEADAAFSQAGKLEPKDTAPCLLAGHARVASGRLDAGIRSYEEALVRDNKCVSARYFLAETLVRAGDFVRASTQLHYVQHLEPHYVPAMLLRGDIAFHQQDFRQAIVEYCAVIDTEQPEAHVFKRLGTAFLAIDDADQALKAFEQAVQLDPEAWDCRFEAARICEARKAMPRARRHYAALVYVGEYAAAATAGLARVDAFLASFDLSEKPAEPKARLAIEPPKAFEAPEVLRRSPGTRPLGAKGPGTRPLGTGPAPTPIPPRPKSEELPPLPTLRRPSSAPPPEEH